MLASHQPGAALHPRPPGSPQVYPEGKAASNTGPAGLRTHLTRPAFSPETAAFRYCFHATAFSFMSPMNAFPFAVLQGGGSPQGRGPSLSTHIGGTFSPDPRRPCAGEHSWGGWRGVGGYVSCWPPSAQREARRPLGSGWAATARVQKVAFALRALGWKHGQRPHVAVLHGSPKQTYYRTVLPSQPELACGPLGDEEMVHCLATLSHGPGLGPVHGQFWVGESGRARTWQSH